MHRTRRKKGKGEEKRGRGKKKGKWEKKRRVGKKKGKIDIAVLGRFSLMSSVVIARDIFLIFGSPPGQPKVQADLVPKNPPANPAQQIQILLTG